MKNRKLMTEQAIGDYIKMLLIGDNGGVYFDITSLLVYGF